MRIRNRLWLAALAAFLGLAVPVGAASAAQQTAFTAELRLIEIGDPERAWLADGIRHVRGEPFIATVSGDLDGMFVVLRDSGIDLATGELVYVNATFKLTTASVRWAGKATQTWMRAKLVGKGTDGSILRALFIPTGEDAAVLSGTILVP